MIRIYGIKTCDTVRKAVNWLKNAQVEFEFIDMRATPLSADTLRGWFDRVDAEQFINKKSRTWRELKPEEQRILARGPVDPLILIQKPTLLKRPIAETDQILSVGFSPEKYQTLFGK